MRSEFILVASVVAMLACHPPTGTKLDAQAETAPPSERMPAGLQLVVEDWAARAQPIIVGALKSGRGSLSMPSTSM